MYSFFRQLQNRMYVVNVKTKQVVWKIPLPIMVFLRDPFPETAKTMKIRHHNMFSLGIALPAALNIKNYTPSFKFDVTYNWWIFYIDKKNR